MQRQNKGFFGDLLGEILPGAGALLGSLVSPLGTIVGGGVGKGLGGLARKIPFKKGGVAMHQMPDGSMMPGKTHGKAKKAKKGPGKGTAAMRAKMAKLRAMRGK